MTDAETYKFLAQLDKNQALTTQALQSVVEKVNGHDSRLTNLESRRWPANTISIVMMIIGAIALVAPYIFR
ncbi:hypothetical protein ACFQS3_02695 [Glycomyces mayteni]|uniref:Uncharacterized protein n=1 Tax=Glycomyces mayteni TaxID=543887 RepID=A0ABW2D214_9ACTN|nr:hypothetical protein GCM10025732_48410 [Glycomyces mayteni]